MQSMVYIYKEQKKYKLDNLPQCLNYSLFS